MTGYYDYVLGLIPTALGGVTAFLLLLGIPLTAAVSVGAGLALIPMCHALFVRNPIEEAGVSDTGTRSEHAGAARTPGSDGGLGGRRSGGAPPGRAD